jgi:predicted glycosyl hydrolase (DUF1957 family)
VGTAKFHPLLPIIPEKEVSRQIELNRETNMKHFGKDGIGFFSPELAIDEKTLKIIRKLGYQWTVVSGVGSQPDKWVTDKIQRNLDGLKIFYRDDIVSNKIAFNEISAEMFVQEILMNGVTESVPTTAKNEFLITAMDGETFGHHIEKYESKFLEQAFRLIEQEENIKSVFISDLIKLFPEDGVTSPRPSSWSTTGKDLKKGIYFPLWDHPSNPVHKVLNKMMKSLDSIISLCDKYYKKNTIDENYYLTARHFYDRSLYSCSSWWASMRPSWSPILIFKGADLMLLAALNAQLALAYAQVDEGEMLYHQITNYFGQLLTELSKQSSNLINAQIQKKL